MVKLVSITAHIIGFTKENIMSNKKDIASAKKTIKTLESPKVQEIESRKKELLKLKVKRQ